MSDKFTADARLSAVGTHVAPLPVRNHPRGEKAMTNFLLFALGLLSAACDALVRV
ncbi:MAG: hypothetical protein KGL11_15180 [Alphaproteobacteria bacterium]|nr:hypothetical protein [Alphaproteobacteria bacterium]